MALTREQCDVMARALKAGLARSDTEALEVGMAALRRQLQALKDAERERLEAGERAAREAQYSLFEG